MLSPLERALGMDGMAAIGRMACAGNPFKFSGGESDTHSTVQQAMATEALVTATSATSVKPIESVATSAAEGIPLPSREAPEAAVGVRDPAVQPAAQTAAPVKAPALAAVDTTAPMRDSAPALTPETERTVTHAQAVIVSSGYLFCVSPRK